MSAAQEQAFLNAAAEMGGDGARESTAPGAPQTALDPLNRETGMNEFTEGGATAAGISESDTVTALNAANNKSQQGATETKAPRDVKLQPREQLEQEIVDYEVEEADMLPIEKPPPSKPSAQTGDKPLPPKISWNAWAGADGAENTRRAAELKEMDRRDIPSPDAPRTAHSDGRRNREDGRGRYGRSDNQRHYRDQRRFGRERSPERKNYRNGHSRDDGAIPRRGNYPPSGMPPGMNYGRTQSAPRFVQSGPVEPVNPSTRPMSTARAMPPGLGIPGAAPRELPQPPHYTTPMENRRAMPMRDNRMRRSRSPPVMRNDRPARQPSPMRHTRNRRPQSPQHSNAIAPPVHRPRSPHRPGPLPYAERPVMQRPAPKGGRPQSVQHEMGPVSNRRERLDPSPMRQRDIAPASPRRFVPPDKRPVYHRPPPAGSMEQEYPRGAPGNPSRFPAAGRWSSPSRDYPRRPVSPSMHRSGVPRRSPPPMHGPMRRHPRDLSPPMRQRRDMDMPFLRREEPDRPPYMMPERGHRPYGPHGDRPSGRYGDHARDPPSSPGRNIKRQRHSPQAEQRFRREPARHRSAMDSPDENPPDSDRMEARAMHYPENECAWYYVDPRGNTQGPCTIDQFRVWLRTLAHDPQFADEHQQFTSVDVWKEGVQRQRMSDLLERNVP